MAAATIDIKVFKKNPDGSWTTLQNTDITVPYGVIRLARDMTFEKGKTVVGLDIAALLDETASQPPPAKPS